MTISIQDDKSGNVSQDDFLLAMEIIFRLYDQDGNYIVTRTNKEIGKIPNLLREPDVANRFSGGVKNVMGDIEAVNLDK